MGIAIRLAASQTRALGKNASSVSSLLAGRREHVQLGRTDVPLTTLRSKAQPRWRSRSRRRPRQRWRRSVLLALRAQRHDLVPKVVGLVLPGSVKLKKSRTISPWADGRCKGGGLWRLPLACSISTCSPLIGEAVPELHITSGSQSTSLTTAGTSRLMASSPTSYTSSRSDRLIDLTQWWLAAVCRRAHHLPNRPGSQRPPSLRGRLIMLCRSIAQVGLAASHRRSGSGYDSPRPPRRRPPR